jgi:hypothetical protein
MARRRMRQLGTLAAAGLGLMLAAAPASASAATTQITTPASTTFYQYATEPGGLPANFATPLTTQVAVSGTSTGLDGQNVDIVCTFGPATGWHNYSGPADEVLPTTPGTTVVNGDGSFSTEVDLPSPVRDAYLDTCVLRAIPQSDVPGNQNFITDANYATDFTGPTIGVDDVDDGEFEQSRFIAPPSSDYLLTGTQLDGYMEWTSVSGCGLSLSYPYDSTFNFEGDTMTATEPLFQCAGALYPGDGSGVDSDITIGGVPAFTPLGAWELYYYSGSFYSLPADTVTETLDPDTGDLTITEVQPLLYCSQDGTTPENPYLSDECSETISTGVTLTRTITEDANGLQAEVSDQFASTAGTALPLDLEYDDHIGGNGQDNLWGPTSQDPNSSPTSPAFSFDGGAYATYPANYGGSGDLVTSFPSAPGSIGIEGEAPMSIGGTIADPQPGIADPQGDITYTTAPTQALFFDANSTDGTSETPSTAAAHFELSYDRTIPASGSVTITQFYSQALTRNGADTLAAQAGDSVETPSVAISSPAAGATVTTATITVSGTASDPVSTPTVTLNGSSVPVTNGTWSTQVTLTPGQNTLTAVATNAAGHQAQAQEMVIYSPPGPPCVVPQIAGLSQSAAQAALTAASCTVGTVLTTQSASVPAGDVISTTPAAGSDESTDYPIELIVSAGPASNDVKLESTTSGKGGSFTLTLDLPDNGALNVLITAGDGGASAASAALHPGSGRFIYSHKTTTNSRGGRVKVTLVPTKRGQKLLSAASPEHPVRLFLYIGFKPANGRAIPKPKRHLLLLY